mmetsp:Transcript_25786/g.28833  ORF Transcript_25786/g.28833 Transcript_25786/m.28833 type:complete len:116 (+) Transcript_25786:89-436(+)
MGSQPDSAWDSSAPNDFDVWMMADGRQFQRNNTDQGIKLVTKWYSWVELFTLKLNDKGLLLSLLHLLASVAVSVAVVGLKNAATFGSTSERNENELLTGTLAYIAIVPAFPYEQD